MFRISKKSKDKEKEKDKKVENKRSKKEKKARERAYYMMGDEDRRQQPLVQQGDDDMESSSYGDGSVDRERTHSGGSHAGSTLSTSLFGTRKVYHVQREHNSHVRKEPHVITTRSSVTGGSQTDLRMSPPTIAKRKSSLKFTPKINQHRSESSSAKHATTHHSTHPSTTTSHEATTKATLITQMHNIRVDSSSSHHPLHPVEETIQAQFAPNSQTSSQLNADPSPSESMSFSLPPLKPLFPTDASRTITISTTHNNATVDSLKIQQQMLTRLRSHSQSTIFLVDGIDDILLGDRLLTINDVCVDSKNLQDIRQMIANRNPSHPFKVTVVPIPDLYELYSRIDKKYLLQAPDQDQPNAAQADLAWYAHENGFSGVKIVPKDIKTNADAISLINDEIDESDTVLLRLEQNGKIIKVDQDSCHKANPPWLDHAENMTALNFINESSILHLLRQRYGNNLIHTFAGPELIVINPFNTLPIYSDKVAKFFYGSKLGDMPPHIYAIVHSAYRNMLSTLANQAIIMMGPSGSGKTTNARFIMSYLTSTKYSSIDRLPDKLKAANVLLDAFGTAKTTINDKASRYINLTSLDFDNAGNFVGASIQAYLLERSRIIRKPNFEGSFSIFYQLLHGSDSTLRADLQMNVENLEKNRFITPRDLSTDKQNDISNWAKVQNALQLLGISQEHAKGIWYIVAGIYHLGFINVTTAETSNKIHYEDPIAAQRAAHILGITQEELSRIIFNIKPSSQATGSNTLSTSSSISSLHSESPPMSPLGSTIESYVRNVDALAMALYDELFSIILTVINNSLASQTVHSKHSITILDVPGLQNYDGSRPSGFDDMIFNYAQERIQSFYHNKTISGVLDRYDQENIDISYSTDAAISPNELVALFDKAPSQGSRRHSTARNEQKGLLRHLDEESGYSGSTEAGFIERLHFYNNDSATFHSLKFSDNKESFIISHCQNVFDIEYNASNWLRYAKEILLQRQASNILSSSSRSMIGLAYQGFTRSQSIHLRTNSPSRLRGSVSSLHKVNIRGGVKKSAPCYRPIFEMDGVLDSLRRTTVRFIHCMIPKCNYTTDSTKAPVDELFDMPLMCKQLQASEIIESVRIFRVGFPENIPYGEFRYRFGVLASAEKRTKGPILDERTAAKELVEELELDRSTFRFGLTQIFFRSNAFYRLLNARDEKITDSLIGVQAICRGYLSRRKVDKLRYQRTAIECIQRNVRKYLILRQWDWWRLLTKVLPLIHVNRTEEEIKEKDSQLESLQARIAKLEGEKNALHDEKIDLEMKVTELSVALAEEQNNATGTAEMLEEESNSRRRLEEEYAELKSELEEVTNQNNQLASDLLTAQSKQYKEEKMERIDESDEESDLESHYSDKIKSLQREHTIAMKRLKDKAEEEMGNYVTAKRDADRKAAVLAGDNEHLQRSVNQLKKKSQRLTTDLEDTRLLLEEYQNKSFELEKKQRKFDSELGKVKDMVEQEKNLKEIAHKEKMAIQTENYKNEQLIEELQQGMNRLKRENDRVNEELKEVVSHGNKGENQLNQLKKSKKDLEAKIDELNEELDDQAGQIQQLEQAKLKLEMATQNAKLRYQKEIETKDEELENVRSNLQKRIKLLEDQLEDEYRDKTAAQKGRREAERQLQEARDTEIRRDVEKEKKLKRDLQRTKALLLDSQMANQAPNKGKSTGNVKDLRDRIEDLETELRAAQKSQRNLQSDFDEQQEQITELEKKCKDLETRLAVVTEDRNELQAKAMDDEAEIDEIIRKQQSQTKLYSDLQKQLQELQKQVHNLEEEKSNLTQEINNYKTRISHLENEKIDKVHLNTAESKARALEQKLETELLTKNRMENTINRVKKNLERVKEERDQLERNIQQAQETIKHNNREQRSLREEIRDLHRKISEQQKKTADSEAELESLQADYEGVAAQLKSANNRIFALQQAVEDNLEMDSDESTDESSDDAFDSTLDEEFSGPTEQHSATRKLTNSGKRGLYKRNSSQDLDAKLKRQTSFDAKLKRQTSFDSYDAEKVRRMRKRYDDDNTNERN